MTSGGQRDPRPGDLAEHETIPPSSHVSSVPAPGVAARTIELPQTLGRYHIKSCLGRGAMGAVFLAHDSELDRDVALKVPLGDTSEGSEWLERFRREARAAGALRHANICPIYDVAEVDGFHHIAMAFVEGQPLSQIVEAGKPIPIRRAVQVVRKVASAIADAHAQKIIHRDLKPANIMIDGKGEPIVMDFGLARQVAAAGSEQLTREGAVAGSPAYMSPEQFEGRGEAIGPGSDIYSLGVVLYELLTGEIPFRGSMMEIMAQILKKSAQPPSTLRDEVDEKLDRICLKMMAKKEADRFGSMKTVVRALSEYLKSDSESKTVPPQPSTEDDLRQIDQACRKADRLIDERKYEAAIKTLKSLPDRLKTSRVREILLDALDLKKQFDGLLKAVEEDLATYEHPERLFRKARRLMQLRPDHLRAREIFAEVSRTKRLPFRIRRSWQAGQFYILAGRTVHVSVLVGILLGIAGVIAASLWSLVLFIPTDDGLVKIELTDPTLSVRVDGDTFTVENLKSPLKFSTGNHKLIIEQDGRQISSTDFTITEGKTERLKVSLLAGELLLERNGNQTRLPVTNRQRPPPEIASAEGSRNQNPAPAVAQPKASAEPVVTKSSSTKSVGNGQSLPLDDSTHGDGPNWITLFDGESLDGWRATNARLCF